MKRYYIFPMIVIILLFFSFIAHRLGYVLWLQGSMIMSVDKILWILLLSIFIIEICIVMFSNRVWYLLAPVLILSFIINIISTETDRTGESYYYEKDGHEILVVHGLNVFSKEIEFYYKDNFLIAKEFASCTEKETTSCGFYIEDENLIVFLKSGLDVHDRIILIPSE